MSSKKRIVLAGLVLAALVIAGAGLTLLLLPGSKSVSTPGDGLAGFEKGGQLALPSVAALQPTGPSEPTPLPLFTASLPAFTPTFTAPVSSGTASGSASISPAGSFITAASTSPARSITAVISPAAISTATAAPRPDSFIIPRRIKIPAIRVETFVERVGVTQDGLMDVPRNIWNTAWFGEGGFRPGEPGNAVVAGHLDAPGTKAVFWDLDKLKPGDKIFLDDAGGRELVFEVYDKKIYPFNNAPLLNIFGPSPEAHLNLITCGGTFDRTSRNYNQRLVVYTRLAAA